jgi:hypothetical protein
MPHPCPICALVGELGPQPIGVVLRLIDAAVRLEQCCPCGATRGHAFVHPHACAQSGCPGWRMATEVPPCPAP